MKSRVSQIERGRVSTREVLDRYEEALSGRLSLMADFGDELRRGLTPSPERPTVITIVISPTPRLGRAKPRPNDHSHRAISSRMQPRSAWPGGMAHLGVTTMTAIVAEVLPSG